MTERSVSPTDRRAATIATGPEWLGRLAPGGFACVMAIGIVSIAAHLLAYNVIGWSLFAANTVFYPAVWRAARTCGLRRVHQP